ncbi:mechanosensitive ion channel domain-containing protein [Tepidamorphus sp. 3E244]|uniref:mechanosensitive ion channel domain-containing protein n=1 Tax=Tepidamorphus sp. 3E244 TaxID=3385498 RepID=UPI0038FC3330
MPVSKATAQTANGSAEEAVSTPAEKVELRQSAGDEEIAARLRRIFRASGWFRNLSVEVTEGIALLDGSAQTERYREWAGSVAAKTEGVIAVVNRITIDPDVNWDFTPAWEEFSSFATRVQRALPTLLLSIVILVAAWQFARLVSYVARWSLKDRISSPLLLTVVARAFAVPVFILGLYLILQISGLTRLALTLLGGTGLIGIALGFAFRDIAENFLASLLLSARNPFRAGDLIRLGEYEGIVKNLNTRTTVLLTVDGNHIQIPNATVFKSVITNYSTNPSRRTDFIVGIGYDDPTGQAQKIIEQTLSEHPAVRDEPAPFVVVDQLAASTVNLRVFFWFDSEIYSPVKLKSALMRQTKQALLNGGISLPDEAREVIFPQGVPIVGEPKSLPDKSASPEKPETLDKEEASVLDAEGGLENEDEAALREAEATASPDEKENLLTSKPSGETPQE